jgi:hypothetical protein
MGSIRRMACRLPPGAPVNTTLILILIARLLGPETRPVPNPGDPGERSSIPGAVISKIVNPQQPSHEFSSSHSRE